MKRLLITIFACLFTLSASAGVLITYPRFYDPENPGAKLCTFEAGGTTPKATYSDRALTTPNANPVVLDSDGMAIIWADTDTDYKLVLLASTYTDCTDIGSPIWTEDDIRGWNEAGDALRDDLAAPGSTTGGNLVGTEGYGTIGEAFPYVADPDATDHGDTTENGAIAKIEAAIDLDEQVIILPGNNNYACTTATTISKNVALDMQQGAIISGTITFDNPGQIVAGPGQQIFAAGTTVTFTNGGTVYPEWWGGGGDGASPSGVAALAAATALTSGGTVRFSGGVYNIEAEMLIVTDGVTFEGTGKESTKLIATATDINGFAIEGDYVTIRDMWITNFEKTGATEVNAIRVRGVTGTLVENVRVTDGTDGGIRISYSGGPIAADNSRVINCDVEDTRMGIELINTSYVTVDKCTIKDVNSSRYTSCRNNRLESYKL